MSRPPAPPPLDAGSRIGGYELVRRIGRGGMAEVWCARRISERRTSKFVALKVVADQYVGNPRFQRMFRSEAELSGLLTHTNIVQVFDEGEDAGRSYLVMEWIDGVNLLKVGAALTFIDDEEWKLKIISYIIGQLLHALGYAHSITMHDGNPLGIVHRDVSPQNVLISNNGEVKLTDFGVAHYLLEESSGIHVKGKVRYMSPEQLGGKTRDPRVDLYAVGAILHELLDGRRFRHHVEDQREMYLEVLSGKMPDLSVAAPVELDDLRRGLLSPEQDDRIPSADAALELLEQYPGYGDARRDLTQLCGGLTGVLRPRVGPGASQVYKQAAPQKPATNQEPKKKPQPTHAQTPSRPSPPPPSTQPVEPEPSITSLFKGNSRQKPARARTVKVVHSDKPSTPTTDPARPGGTLRVAQPAAPRDSPASPAAPSSTPVPGAPSPSISAPNSGQLVVIPTTGEDGEESTAVVSPGTIPESVERGVESGPIGVRSEGTDPHRESATMTSVEHPGQASHSASMSAHGRPAHRPATIAIVLMGLFAVTLGGTAIYLGLTRDDGAMETASASMLPHSSTPRLEHSESKSPQSTADENASPPSEDDKPVPVVPPKEEDSTKTNHKTPKLADDIPQEKDPPKAEGKTPEPDDDAPPSASPPSGPDEPPPVQPSKPKKRMKKETAPFSIAAETTLGTVEVKVNRKIYEVNGYLGGRIPLGKYSARWRKKGQSSWSGAKSVAIRKSSKCELRLVIRASSGIQDKTADSCR